MELTIDFLSFRPCEREDMMHSSVYDQGRVQARCYRRRAATVNIFSFIFIVWQAGHHHRQERISFVTRICAALPQHMAVRLGLTVTVPKISEGCASRSAAEA